MVEKIVLDKPLDSVAGDSTFAPGGLLSTLGDGSIRPLKPLHKLKPSIEISCNNQVSGIYQPNHSQY